MPEKKTIARAKRDKAEGKAPSTQAGEFVREEIEHIREGKARRAQHEAGDRDRPFEGAPRGGEARNAEDRQRRLEEGSHAREADAEEAEPEALPRRDEGLEEGRRRGRVPARPLPPRARRGEEAEERRPESAPPETHRDEKEEEGLTQSRRVRSGETRRL